MGENRSRGTRQVYPRQITSGDRDSQDHRIGAGEVRGDPPRRSRFSMGLGISGVSCGEKRHYFTALCGTNTGTEPSGGRKLRRSPPPTFVRGRKPAQGRVLGDVSHGTA